MTDRSFAGQDVGDLIPAALRGYRQWSLIGYLTSRGRTPPHLFGSYGQAWLAPTMQARCGNEFAVMADRAAGDLHEAPHDGCRCGIYAYYRPDAVGPDLPGRVFGVVEATGRILLGDRGFRAEHARILALCGSDSAMDWAAQRYPGVASFPTPEALLEHYPPEDVSGLGIVVDETPAFVATFAMSGRQAAKAFADAMQAAHRAMLSSAAALDSLNALAKKIAEDGQPEDPKARALRLRRGRHTGPAQHRYRLDGSRT
jgi:hypothetical protein